MPMGHKTILAYERLHIAGLLTVMNVQWQKL